MGSAMGMVKKAADPLGILGLDKQGASNIQGAQITNGTNQKQMDTAYDQTQSGLSQQQQFVNALQAQNGIGNQSAVFQQQQDLANQLQAQANGGGPNPAMNQLNQQTGNNVAAQAALMAGQRGAGANAGLMARQAAMQGANTQQQAVGQAATMQANQQIAAQQALAQQQGAMASLAGNQVAQQGNALSGYNQFAQGQQANLLNANSAYNTAQVANVASTNKLNADADAAAKAEKGKMMGGLMSAAGGVAGGMFGGPVGASMGSSLGGSLGSSMGKAHGGLIESPKSRFAQMLANGGAVDGEQLAAAQMPVPGKALMKGDTLKNDRVPANLSPGEVVIPRSIMMGKDPAKMAAAFVQQVLSKNPNLKENYASGGMVADDSDEEGDAGAEMSPALKGLVDGPQGGSLPELGFLNNQEDKDYDKTLMARMNSSLNADASRAPAVDGVAAPMDQMVQDSNDVSAMPMPSASSSPADSSGTSGFMKGVNEQKQGLMKMANAEAEQGKAEATIQQKSIEQQQEAAKTFNQHWAELDQERKARMEDFNNGHIDPNRYVGSMTTGQKVATSIGLILGGLGSALTGGENPVMKHLDQQIQLDVDAQKAELGKKQTLLSMNMQQYGNLKDAEAMTRIQMGDMTKAQLEKAAAESKDPMAKARAQHAIGVIDQATAPLMAQMAAKKTMVAGVKSGAIPALQAVNTIIPVGPDREKASEEIQKVKEYQDSVKKMANLYDRANKLNRLMASLPEGEQAKKRETINAEIQTALMQGPLKGIRMDDAKTKAMIKPYLVDFKSGPEEHQVMLNGLKSTFGGNLGTPTLDRYDIKMSKDASTMNDQQQRLYNYAMKNPNDPNSKAILQRLGK